MVEFPSRFIFLIDKSPNNTIMSQMNKENKITLVTNGDDWEGLYLNGKLFSEDHSIPILDVCAALDVEMERLEVSTEYLGNKVSNLPKELSKIPKKYIVS